MGLDLPENSARLFLGIYAKDAFSLKDTCSTTLIAALFTIERNCKQPGCPSTEEWIKKVVHLHKGISLNLNEVTQTQKDKY